MSKLEQLDLKEILSAYLDALLATFKETLDGVYVHGSILWDTYEKGKSDVDLVVVLKTDYLESWREQVTKLHESRQHLPLEVSYITLGMAKCTRKYDQERLYYNSGEVKLCAYGEEWWFEIDMLYRFDTLLYGNDRFDGETFVSSSDMRTAARNCFFDDWYDVLKGKKALSMAYVVYGLETLPRILYTYEQGKGTSKKEGIKWFLPFLDSNDQDVMKACLSKRWDKGSYDHNKCYGLLLRLLNDVKERL